MEVNIGPNGNKESNYLIMMAYLGNKLGVPIESETDDSIEFSSGDGSVILEDTCYWESTNSKYEMIIESSIEQDGENDELYKGVYYKSVSLIITPIDK